MKRYLSRALPIAAVLVLLAGSEAIRAQAPLPCTNPGPPCVNPINVDAGNCNKSAVKHEVIRFPRKVNGNDNRNIQVKWTLPNGFGFCPQPASGDGVFLKGNDPDNQFTSIVFEGPPASVPFPCNRPTVMLTARNSVPNRTYPYRIRFHSADGNTTCTIDPTMVNE